MCAFFYSAGYQLPHLIFAANQSLPFLGVHDIPWSLASRCFLPVEVQAVGLRPGRRDAGNFPGSFFHGFCDLAVTLYQTPRLLSDRSLYPATTPGSFNSLLLPQTLYTSEWQKLQIPSPGNLVVQHHPFLFS